MTKRLKKEIERFFVEEAAKQIGRTWILDQEDRESPDFIISENGEIFGLEVQEIFRDGSESKAKGSALKRKEREGQKAINALRKAYENCHSIPLVVKFLGDMDESNMSQVVPGLLRMDLPSKEDCYQDSFVIRSENWRIGDLKIFVTKKPAGLYPEWYTLNDRVGWVDQNPVSQIDAAIKAKAKKLSCYKKAIQKVRLLLVANRRHNSGKMILEKLQPVDHCGFDAVYFFSYPDTLHVLPK